VGRDICCCTVWVGQVVGTARLTELLLYMYSDIQLTRYKKSSVRFSLRRIVPLDLILTAGAM